MAGPGMRAVIVALAVLAALPGLAAAKGLRITLTADPGGTRVGETVTVAVAGRSEVRGEPAPPCRGMRVVVVAPGIGPRRALRAVEGGRGPGRIGRWDAFRLGSLRQTAPLRWRGALRPHRPGRWTLIVPNWCVAGYVLPLGVTRIAVDVAPARG